MMRHIIAAIGLVCSVSVGTHANTGPSMSICVKDWTGVHYDCKPGQLTTANTVGAPLLVRFGSITGTRRVWISSSEQYADSPDYYTLHQYTYTVGAGFNGMKRPICDLLPCSTSGGVEPGHYRIDADVNGHALPTLTVSVYAPAVSGGWGCPPSWKKPYPCPPPKTR